VDVCLQVVSTTTDNGANFVEAFRVYGPAENEAVTIDLRNTCQEDDETDFNEPVAIQYQNIAENIDECQLPNRHRCAFHTLNLLVTRDIEKVPRWSTGYQPCFRKVNCSTPGLRSRKSHHPTPTPTPGNFDSPTPTPTPTPARLQPSVVLVT